MDFNPENFGPAVARILALDGNGERRSALRAEPCSSQEARREIAKHSARELFPNASEPDAALAGLWLYFSCFEEAHQLIPDSNTSDTQYWHAILHRREPDAGNAAYWFRKVGRHPIYHALGIEAAAIIRKHPEAEFRVGRWDPYDFVEFCERARRQPGSKQELAAQEIQHAEWKLLFQHCARVQASGMNPGGARTASAGRQGKAGVR
jgi:hypothetical protein